MLLFDNVAVHRHNTKRACFLTPTCTSSAHDQASTRTETGAPDILQQSPQVLSSHSLTLEVRTVRCESSHRNHGNRADDTRPFIQSAETQNNASPRRGETNMNFTMHDPSLIRIAPTIPCRRKSFNRQALPHMAFLCLCEAQVVLNSLCHMRLSVPVCEYF
jgi:hypothetical protein